MAPKDRAARASSASKEQSVNWKEHPLTVATVAVVATSLFFMTVVLPIWLKTTEEELKTLREAAKGHEKVRQEVSRLKLELAALKSQNPFTGGDPYPLGFRLVRLGDDLRVLEGIYDKERISWKDELG